MGTSGAPPQPGPDTRDPARRHVGRKLLRALPGHVQSLLHDDKRRTYPAAIPGRRSQRQVRQLAGDAWHLPGLSRADSAQQQRWARACDGALGHAIFAKSPDGRHQEARGEAPGKRQAGRFQGTAPDGAGHGTTNIRNVSSTHWKRWLGPENRCLAPFTSFSEYDPIDGKKTPVWFASDESRPLLCFAGLWTNWTSVRKAKEGEVTADFPRRCRSTGAHPKAMRVLTTPEEHDVWMRFARVLGR